MKTRKNTSLSGHPLANQIFCTLNGFTVELCSDQKSLNTAFNLRYRAYLEAGAVEENEEELLYDDYDFLPNAFTHLVWYQGKPVTTVRACIYSDEYNWQKTEGICYFEEDVKNKLGEKVRLLESNRYVVDPDFQGRQSLFAQLLMFRTHALNSIAHQCRHIITSVRSNHIAFYRRYLGMEPISSKTNYIEWVDADVELVSNRVDLSLACALRRSMPSFTEEEVARYATCAGLSNYVVKCVEEVS